MKNNTKLYILLFVLFVMYLFYNNNKLKENFIVLVEDKIIPENCPDKLFFDGKYYYLHNTKKAFKQGSNPLIFRNIKQW